MPHEFEAQDGDLRTSAFPGIVRANGTNIPVSGYAFDAAAQENLFFRFRASGYVSGNIAVDLDWYADTATTSNVVWGAQIAAITPSSDAQDIETDALATVATVVAPAGSSSQRLMRATATITVLDSIAPDDQVVLCISRQVANGSDLMAGDAILTYVTVDA